MEKVGYYPPVRSSLFDKRVVFGIRGYCTSKTCELAKDNLGLQVDRTWKCAIEKIKTSSPDSLPLLYQAAYLASENIPSTLFSAGEKSPEEIAKLLQPLETDGLLKRCTSEGNYSIDPSAQAAIQDQLSAEMVKETLIALFDKMGKVWEFNVNQPATWQEARTLFWHVKSLCDKAHPSVGKEEEKWGLLSSLGNFCVHVERNEKLEIEFFQQALEIGQKIYKNDSTPFAACLNNIGSAYIFQNDSSLAIDYLTQALTILKNGERNEDTDAIIATVLSNIGTAKQVQGDLQQAVEYLVQALEIQRKVLGEEHTKVAQLVAALTIHQGSLGALDEARKHGELAHAIFAKNGEEKCFYAIYSGMVLGKVYYMQGAFAKAREHCERALNSMLETKPPDLDGIVSCLQTIGQTYLREGNGVEAEWYLQKAIEVEEKGRKIEE